MNLIIAFAGLLGASAVITGAVSAHGDLTDYSRELVDKAVQYQVWHALLLLIVAQLGKEGSKILKLAAGCFSLGVILFCGSLYSLGFLGERLFSFSAPMGGSLLILGWASLCLYGLKQYLARH